MTVTATYPFGCIYKNAVTLTVNKGYELVFPTAFTPNFDTINDMFRPVFKELQFVRIDIFNSSGALLFSEEGITLQGWNGTINGIPGEIGNYYYHFSAQTYYGKLIVEEDTFLLIR